MKVIFSATLQLLVKSFSLIFLLFLSIPLKSQRWFEPKDSFNMGRVALVGSAQAAVYGSSFAALHYLWYSDYRNGKFHTFKDIKGWEQMDKVGHATTSYQIANNLFSLNRWTGMRDKSAMLWAAVVGYSYQTLIEIEDGYSTGWGWSWVGCWLQHIGFSFFSQPTGSLERTTPQVKIFILAEWFNPIAGSRRRSSKGAFRNRNAGTMA